MEQTFIIVKPDAVQRGLVGEIIGRFEKTGLKIVAMKMLQASEELANKHYPKDRKEFIEGMGNKSLSSYKELGIDPAKHHKSTTAHGIGLDVQGWLSSALTSGPLIAGVLEGPHAIELVRKICGNTLPLKAEPGTIRGDYSFDSSALANKAERPIRNLIHASGNAEEAKHEIELWFKPEELHNYDTVHQKHMLD